MGGLLVVLPFGGNGRRETLSSGSCWLEKGLHLLIGQRYRGVNISFNESGMSGIFCFTTGKVCIMSGNIEG
jgi:hypothetical protein